MVGEPPAARPGLPGLYGLQSNGKTVECRQHADRDAQFRDVNRSAKAFQRRGEPVGGHEKRRSWWATSATAAGSGARRGCRRRLWLFIFGAWIGHEVTQAVWISGGSATTGSGCVPAKQRRWPTHRPLARSKRRWFSLQFSEPLALPLLLKQRPALCVAAGQNPFESGSSFTVCGDASCHGTYINTPFWR